jgi:SAM-dependent methyltransferase
MSSTSGENMYIVERSLRFAESFLKAYGPTNIKKYFWEKEYSGDKWNFADDTADDCVYAHIEKFSLNGKILDMGCGSGNTANEMAITSYKSYLGVDISEAALAKADRRSRMNGRQEKNSFECGDIMHYVPKEGYDVILFRESMYHVPINKIKATLDRYSQYQNDGGVLIVRLFAASREVVIGKDKPRPTAMLNLMENEFDVVEKGRYQVAGHPTVLVLRPKKEIKD